MLYSDLYGRLIILTKRNDITHVEIGKCLNLEKGAITGRAKRNSNFKEEEITKIEQYFNVDLSSIPAPDINEEHYKINTHPDISLKEKSAGFIYRLIKLQRKTGLNDKDFAKLLRIDKDEYTEFKSGDRKPNLNLLLELKQNFDVTLDWLILGN